MDEAGIDAAIEDYIEAAFPGGDSGSGNVCVLRRPPGGDADAVLFSAGYGDGGYPTVVGRDAKGRIASLVSVGYVLPRFLSGLPGTPPSSRELE